MFEGNSDNQPTRDADKSRTEASRVSCVICPDTNILYNLFVSHRNWLSLIIWEIRDKEESVPVDVGLSLAQGCGGSFDPKRANASSSMGNGSSLHGCIALGRQRAADDQVSVATNDHQTIE
ncbi:hypothetical protein EIK77_004593 [Talaromyces pinophilus]|nr:hypothetical protein EIK77_004593 [Talaromyces pinophilus]